MTYPTLPNNASGMDVLLTTIASGEPEIIGIILLFLWVVVTVSSYFINLRRGSGSIFSSGAVACIVIDVVMAAMMLAPGAISGDLAAFVFVWNVIWIGLFFVVRER